jgi:hypothetical protein
MAFTAKRTQFIASHYSNAAVLPGIELVLDSGLVGDTPVEAFGRTETVIGLGPTRESITYMTVAATGAQRLNGGSAEAALAAGFVRHTHAVGGR